MIAAMNELDYTAMEIGNHEFNFGLDVLSKVRREAKFPLLAANLRRTGASNPAGIEPYVIRTLAGVRVGIVGFVTPGVPYWELPENYAGYEFEGIVHAAQRVVPEVRAKSDLVVVIMHSGLSRHPTSGEPLAEDRITGENAAGALAEKVTGIDVIFYGHSHREFAGKSPNGVVLAQANYWGRSLAEADVEMERNEDGTWRVAKKSSLTIPVTSEVAADAQILAIAKPYHDGSEAWLAERVARTEVEQSSRLARIEADPLFSLIHSAQREAGSADVSLATMNSTHVSVAPGAVTVRDLFSLYPYENTLFTVEMSGALLKEVLEHAASFYPAWPAKPGEELRPPGYEVDAAEGVSYIIDLTQASGQRIRELTFNGKPLDPAQPLRVAVNDYRYYGGGGYTAFRGLPIVWRSRAGIRNLLIDYVTKRAPLLARETTKNWRIEPRAASEALRAEALR